MAATQKSLPVDEIRYNPRFRFSSDRDPGILAASIRESGILSPLVLVRDVSGSLDLFAGFRRYQAAMDLGLKEVPVRIAAKGEDRGRVFYGVLLEQLCFRMLTLLEKARVLKIMEILEVRGALRTTFMELLQIPDQRSVIESLQSLAASPFSLQAFVELHQPPLKMVEPLLEWSPEDLDILMQAAGALQLRPVELLEIAGLAKEAAGRDREPVAACLEAAGIREWILPGNPLPRGRKIQVLKQRLYQRRHPRLSEWNEGLDKLKESSRPPPGTEILWDRTLEKPGLEIRSALRNKEDLHRLSEWLNRETVIQVLDGMFPVAG